MHTVELNLSPWSSHFCGKLETQSWVPSQHLSDLHEPLGKTKDSTLSPWLELEELLWTQWEAVGNPGTQSWVPSLCEPVGKPGTQLESLVSSGGTWASRLRDLGFKVHGIIVWNCHTLFEYVQNNARNYSFVSMYACIYICE